MKGEKFVQVFGIDDGSALVVVDMDPPEIQPEGPEDGTLSIPTETFTWIGEAVAAGVTFDVLKQTVVGLTRRGWARKKVRPSAESATATVKSYLISCGYQAVRVTEARRIEKQGWTVTGTADEATFRGLVDESGHVAHVRIA